MAIGTKQPQSRRWSQGKATNDRQTHPLHFAEISERHGPFTLDVAAAAHNAKCDRYFDVDADGLTQDWSGERVWCNPPYSDITPWIRKAWSTWSTTRGIAMLLPASRTEQGWWQTLVEPYRDRPGSPLRCEFLPGRMHFLRPGHTAVQSGERPPFGCVLLVWQLDVFRPDAVRGGLFDPEVTR